MLKALLVRYRVDDLDFLRNASFPKLESLGVSSILPPRDKTGHTEADKAAMSSSTGGVKQVGTHLWNAFEDESRGEHDGLYLPVP